MQTNSCKEIIKSFSDNNLSYIKITSPEIELTDISKIFSCGQSFRFERYEHSRHEKEFCGVAYGKFVSFAQDDNELYIYNTNEAEYLALWQRYLALDLTYNEIMQNILENISYPVINEALNCGRGIRILNQEPWEVICSFIISQNNNIPRIKKIIKAISKALGEKIDAGNMTSHGASDVEFAFPTPSATKNCGVSLLCDLKTGFRAKYIFDAAQKVANGDIDINQLYALTTEQCISELCKIYGVGLKVANCCALFAFEKYDAFPVDVWIKRVLEKYFDENVNISAFGKYAGIAQQYLFYYEKYLQFNR